MTEDAPDRILSGIDIPKTIAGVLAAVSAAVVGSFLGVAGTLAGAAVASLVGSVGTEVYHRSINKTRRKLQGTFMTAPAAVGTPPVPAAPSPRKIRWSRVALVAGALFVLAMGTLTAAELVAGRSVADVTRGTSGDRSTLSSILDDKSGTDRAPAVSPSSPSPSGTSTPEAPKTAGTEPTTAPTTAPATEAPTGEPSAPTDTGDGDGSGSGSGTDKSGTGSGLDSSGGGGPGSDNGAADASVGGAVQPSGGK